MFGLKKKLIWGFVILLSCIFIFIPFPASDLIIRVYFDDIEGDYCALYYTTDTQSNWSEEQCVSSKIDYAQKSVAFRLDGSLEGHLTSLRLDFPHSDEQLICIKTITVSSAGVIQKEYNPCSFFADENITSIHEASINLVRPKGRTYLSVTPDDPYVVFSTTLTRQIEACYSHQVLSRLALCLFLLGIYAFDRKKIFFSKYNIF